MKIGFIDYIFNREAPIGSDGLSEVVWNLAGPLVDLGHEVHIAAPYLDDKYPHKGVQVHPFPVPIIGYRNVVGNILIVRRAIQTLQRYGPFDVFHAPEYVSTALLTLFERNTPIILTEPGNIYDRIANGNPYDFYTTQAYKLAAKRTARAAASVIATSDIMAYWWERTGTSPNRIAHIPLGVNLSDFEPVPNARQILAWSETQQHLLFAARLSVETGAQYLLEALPGVLHEFPNTQLHIVGSGKAEDNLHKQAAELKIEDKITWHGWVPLKELAKYYSASDAMVFPGISGGTPRVMLQAMACNTPFVGSAIGGITDHVKDDITGLLTPPANSVALATAIKQVLRQPIAAKARAERARVYVQTLKWSNIAERVYAEVYCAVAKKMKSENLKKERA